jgi:hypothetical protein
MNSRFPFRLTPIAVAITLVLTLACEGAPETETTDPDIAELQKAGPAECLVACRSVVSCLGSSYGNYGGGYGNYGGGYGNYGGGYGDYGGGYGAGGYGCGYAACGSGESSPDWCGYGGYGDGYGGYGNLPGYGGPGYGGAGYGGTCTGSGTNMVDQCVAGCRSLPARTRRHLLSCVMAARTCQARLACE